MRLFKVSFAPILGMDDKGEPTKVGRYMAYVTAREANGIQAVLDSAIPQYSAGGFEIVEEIDHQDNRVWSVNVGPESRSQSVIVVAPNEEAAGIALAHAVQETPNLRAHVAVGLFRTTEIDLSKEGVW